MRKQIQFNHESIKDNILCDKRFDDQYQIK